MWVTNIQRRTNRESNNKKIATGLAHDLCFIRICCIDKTYEMNIVASISYPIFNNSVCWKQWKAEIKVSFRKVERLHYAKIQNRRLTCGMEESFVQVKNQYKLPAFKKPMGFLFTGSLRYLFFIFKFTNIITVNIFWNIYALK